MLNHLIKRHHYLTADIVRLVDHFSFGDWLVVE